MHVSIYLLGFYWYNNIIEKRIGSYFIVPYTSLIPVVGDVMANNHKQSNSRYLVDTVIFMVFNIQARRSI